MSNFYVIGNGFDLHHKLETSYNNYKEYLKIIDSDLVTKIDEILVNSSLSEEIKYWSHLEDDLSVISYLDYDNIYDESFQCSEDDIERASYWHDPGYNSEKLTETLKKIILGLKKYFNEWINSIPVNSNIIKGDLLLDVNDYFLNFNYTKTLEIIYNINEKNILHIHCNNGKYILGHNQEIYLPFSNQKEANFDEQLNDDSYDDVRSIEVKNVLNSVCNELHREYYKNSKELINKNNSFFNHVSSSNNIIFMGLSCGKEDEIYIKEISKKVLSNTKIIFYYHNDDDYQNFVNITNIYFKLNNVKYIKW